MGEHIPDVTFQDEEMQAHFTKKMLDPTRTRDKKKKSNDCPKGSGSTAHNLSEVIDALLLTSLAFKSFREIDKHASSSQ